MTSMTRGPQVARSITAVGPAGARRARASIVTEAPLEIRLRGPRQAPAPVSVTMRTPGHDFELAVGFLVGEQLIGVHDVRSVRYCVDADDGAQQFNVVTVDVATRVDSRSLTRRFGATAACGLCGKTTLDDLALRCEPVGAGPTVGVSRLTAMPGALRREQRVFERTGGLHAAALFRSTGELVVGREDVGRHNAVDKVVGNTVLEHRSGLPDQVLVVSGRVGYEIVQKAAVAGIPIVAGVSAPSTLAVDTAQRFGITLVGFLRGDCFNVYTHDERLDLAT